MAKKKTDAQIKKEARAADAVRVAKELADAKTARADKRDLRMEYRDDITMQESIRQAVIEDIHRVKEHPDNNSFNSPVSRNVYRRLGHYPQIIISDLFGGVWAEALREADLEESRTVRRAGHKASTLRHHQRIAEYADREVLPLTGLYDYSKGKNNRGIIKVLVGADFHSWFVDPFALQVFLDMVELSVAPLGTAGEIVLNGDVWDFPQISRHRKMPGHFHLNLHQERVWGRDKIIGEIRKRAPEATIHFVMGNHEYRLVTYLADKAAELAGLPELEFETFLGLHENRINLVCRSNFLAPTAKARKMDIRENWFKMHDAVLFHHGTSCAKNASAVEMANFNCPIVTCHTHRPQLYYANSVGTGPISCMTLPMMAGFAVGKDYVMSNNNWTMGFGEVTIDLKSKQSILQIHPVYQDWAQIGTRVWRATKKVRDRRAEQMAVTGQ